MVSLSPEFSNLTRFANLFSQPGGRSSQTLSKVDVQSQTQTGLSIVTAEGDRVTLSTNASYQGTGVKYNARGVAEGQAISLRSNALEGEISSQKQITIEGDLNEQEIEDIKKLVNQVNGLRQDVITGDVKAILANGQQLGATGSIASVALNIQHSESVTTQQASLRQRSQPQSSPSGQVAPGHQGGRSSGTSPLDFLKEIFQSLGRNSRSDEGLHGAEKAIASQTPIQNAVIENKPPLETQEQPKKVEQAEGGLVQFLNEIGEKIFQGAKKIAKLANRLVEKVERQAGKIAKTIERISEAIANGNEEKAERLQQKVDRRINRLGRITEKIGERIERAANKLNKLIDSLTERLVPSKALSGETAPIPPSTPIEDTNVEESQTEQKPIGETITA
jgi:archaellum component FlaC